MEIIAALHDSTRLPIISPFVDGIVVYSNDFSSFYMKGYNKEEIKEIIKSTTKKVIIDLEFMLENDKLESLSNFIDYFKDDVVYYKFQDLGVFQLLKEKGKENYGIYNPNTLITNHYDMNFYLEQGMYAITVSLEITLADQIQMLKKRRGKVFFEVFGYHLMFHSKRKLVSMYKKFIGSDASLDNYNSFLIEQTRKDKYHIFESNKGTTLFRPYILSYFDNLDELKDIDLAFINNMFLKNEHYEIVLKVFSDYKNKLISKEEGLAILGKLPYEFNDGFKYQDTVYQKESA